MRNKRRFIGLATAAVSLLAFGACGQAADGGGTAGGGGQAVAGGEGGGNAANPVDLRMTVWGGGSR